MMGMTLEQEEKLLFRPIVIIHRGRGRHQNKGKREK
jgi:hypothetical protein